MVALADAVIADNDRLDVVVNNAGVFTVSEPITESGLDVRFMVNVIAPYLLTLRLLPHLSPKGRVINLSSAAQAPVDPAALTGTVRLDDSMAYAQSKLALTMWSTHLAAQLGPAGPVVISVNPGSFLATKMVKDAYGTAGYDVGIGVDILTRAALSDEFADATGRYYDNDNRRFASPHPKALDPAKDAALVEVLDATIDALGVSPHPRP